VRRAVGTGAIGVLGTWYAATAAAQFSWVRRRMDKLDVSGMLLPSWRFFAPWPAVHDLDLFCRDQLADGTVTPFRDVTIVQARRWQHSVFHANRRHEKGVFDLCQATVFLAARWPLEQLQLTLPYLTLLNWVTLSCAHHPDAVRTQFLIGRSAAYDDSIEPDFLFASDFHELRAPAEVIAG
jgi:hypothetical protein